MHISKKNLDLLINESIQKEQNRLIRESAMQAAAVNAVVGLLSTSDGRKTLANVVLFVPNLIESLCDAEFPPEDTSGKLLSNMKNKLCKLSGYMLANVIGLPCKIVGEMLLMLNDDSAKVVVNTIEGVDNTKTPSGGAPDPMPGHFELDNVPTGNIDIPYSPESELALMENRELIRKIILKEMRHLRRR